MTIGHLLLLALGVAVGFCWGAWWAWDLARNYFVMVTVMESPLDAPRSAAIEEVHRQAKRN